MHDVLPDETHRWQRVERRVRALLESSCYREIRLPTLEKTELFSRSIGLATDIVNKEMYTFPDRNGESLTLRPEGTAGCVRALVQHGSLHAGVCRVWYCGPMFRRERPQQGRLRQFHQVGAEAFGSVAAELDAELILMSARIWKTLGITSLCLQLNSLGSADARQTYRSHLVEYFNDHRAQLDDDSIKRLESNPLRILDSKNPAMQSLIAAAPPMSDCMDEESTAHFATLRALLDGAGLDYEINPRLVRGLDYYNRTVFEWVTDRLGAQGTLCAGGRYDGLVAQFGGPDTPAAGFAMGLERVLALLALDEAVSEPRAPQVYQVLVGEEALHSGLQLAEQLRDAMPTLSLCMHCGGGSFRSQLKKADKSRAEYALILGNAEVTRNTVLIKPLRRDTAQYEVAREQLADELSRLLRPDEPAADAPQEAAS